MFALNLMVCLFYTVLTLHWWTSTLSRYTSTNFCTLQATAYYLAWVYCAGRLSALYINVTKNMSVPGESRTRPRAGREYKIQLKRYRQTTMQIAMLYYTCLSLGIWIYQDKYYLNTRQYHRTLSYRHNTFCNRWSYIYL